MKTYDVYPIRLNAAGVEVLVYETEQAAGEAAADRVAGDAILAATEGKDLCFWLMAAPSGFAFYRAFVDRVRKDSQLADVVRTATFFQFDDYPVGRDDPAFGVTFRALLEEHVRRPLADSLGAAPRFEFLEIGSEDDETIAAEYTQKLRSRLEDPRTSVIEVKGIGMDGHWGFHDGSVPLDSRPEMIRVELGSQNLHQQMLDWPQYFETAEDVPSFAFTANVPMFLMADSVVDIVPQASKQFSVLATYGTDDVINSIPSSAIKKHHNASAFLTRTAADVLLSFAERRSAGDTRLSESELLQLRELWGGPNSPFHEENTEAMMDVLRELKLT